MRTRRGSARAAARSKNLNDSSAPRSEREWIVYRAGVIEGVELAQRDAYEKAETFAARVLLSGVALSTPSAAAACGHPQATPPRRRRPA